jgi:hypothetical protein
MAEENSVKRAVSLIMGSSENSSDGAQLRILILLILLVGVGLSGYSIYLNKQYIPPIIIKAEPEKKELESVEKKLVKMVEDLNAFNAIRMHSMEVASDISSMARYPFVSDKVTQVADATLGVPTVVIIPPYIRVRATMTLENKSVALLDIEGEPSSKIYKVGERFAEGKGRISRITLEKVTIVYEGKEFVYTP